MFLKIAGLTGDFNKAGLCGYAGPAAGVFGGPFLKLLTGSIMTLVLSGCMTVPADRVDYDDCIETNYTNLLIFSSRRDSFNKDCATAQAAATISKGKDPVSQAVAVQIYKNTNPDVAQHVDKILDMDPEALNNLAPAAGRRRVASCSEKKQGVPTGKVQFVCQ